MADLKVIKGGREQMGRKALSAVLTGDDTKVEELLSIMQPRNPQLAVIRCRSNKDLKPGRTAPEHRGRTIHDNVDNDTI